MVVTTPHEEQRAPRRSSARHNRPARLVLIPADANAAVYRIKERMMTDPVALTQPAPVHLTDDIAEAVNGAFAQGTAVVFAYVDERGAPHLSLRGTVQVFGPKQLALWVRSEGLPRALRSNDRVALLYQNLAARTFYQFAGRARVAPSEGVRDAVFAGSPEREQARDPERLGVAVLVDVDIVEGMGPDGPVRMAAS
ncbi:MAG: pyridoxamine 5'-phosphate oxidase family protein [Acidimicrobiales bacterium]